MKRFLSAFFATSLLLCAASASAQVVVIDSYTLKSYAVGALSPTSTFTFLSSAVICNQVAPPVTTTINATRAIWNDPNNLGRVCIWIDPGTGPLFSLPLGDYEATLTAVNSVGASAESARAPFSKQAAPATVTGLRLSK